MVMEKIGYLEITVSGAKGNLDLVPETLDIKELIEIIEQAERLLFPGERKDRPLISYQIEAGSVRNIFRTSLQAIIAFSAVIAKIEETKSIDFLELNTAKAIESFQETAVKKGYIFEIKTSLENSPVLKIDKSTFYYRNSENWVDAEFYFYGKITDAGGKDKANIHLTTEEFGTLFIQTPQEFLANIEQNILYKNYIIRAKGKQNSSTGEIDKQSLSFIELIDYNAQYDAQYLKKLRSKAMTWLNKIEPEDWLKEIRGYDVWWGVVRYELFFRFLNENDELFQNADKYYHFFLQKEIKLFISTISIAEYCVGGSIDELPLKNLIVLPFNIKHAEKAGEFGRILYELRKEGELDIEPRQIIINDAKLFAQAHIEEKIGYFITSDSRCIKIYNNLKMKTDLNFVIVNIKDKPSETFGILDL